MIIRDPPGGNSYAQYSNVVTTIKSVSDHHQVSSSGGLGLGLSAQGGINSQACIGAGGGIMGVIALSCIEAGEGKASGSVNIGTSLDTDLFNADKETTNSFSTTWSYTTSSSPARAGAESDVFVVPNLNVLYTEVYQVYWNSTDCKPSLVPKIDTAPIEYEFPTVFEFDVGKYILILFLFIILSLFNLSIS